MRRVCIVGGGSAYMPGIAFAVAHAGEVFEEAVLVLHDVDPEALDLQRRLTTSILRSRGSRAKVESTTDRLRALEGADAVLTTFRPGGFPARHLDERIAIDHGVIGQETAGPGGFAMALRSVPIVLEIAEEMRRVAPGAVLLNYTNPVQTVTEAVTRFVPDVPFVGLCDQTEGERAFIARLMGCAAADVELDTAGTNHMTFTRAVRVAGRDVTAELWSLLDELDLEPLPSEERRIVLLFRELRAIPSEYMQYFRFHDEVLAERRASGRTRAEEVMASLPAVLESYSREADSDYPRPSMARASEEHGDFAVSVMAAMLSGGEGRFILNLANHGQVDALPEGAVVETPASVMGRSIEPIPQGRLPGAVEDLVLGVAEHCRLTAEAAVNGDRGLALDALALHPLVASRELAGSLLDAYLAAHSGYLPAFRRP